MTAPSYTADYRAPCPCGVGDVWWRAPNNTGHPQPDCRACVPMPDAEPVRHAERLRPVSLSPR